tara:strand:- start:30695 stop:34300 length:3606 start_codon:yes stop_codon:yes gene_type:complete
MRNIEKNFVIVVDIANADALKKELGDSADPDLYLQRVDRPVANKLQKLCGEHNASLSNKVSPFVIETSGSSQIITIARALVGSDENSIRFVPKGLEDPIQFYVGISCSSRGSDEEDFRGVAHAHALAGGAGPNEIYIEDEVAESLTASDMGELEVLLLGRHRLLENRDPTRIYQLRAIQQTGASGEVEGEIVRLSLVVIDILHSTSIKPLMGANQEERLANYENKVLKPFREYTATLAKQFGGNIVDQTGDSCFLSFPDPDPARLWTLEVLKEPYRIPAPAGYECPHIQYHLSIDTGKVMRNAEGTLQGSFVDRVHRLNDLSQEDQIILSPSVAFQIQDVLGDETSDGKVHRHNAVSLQGIVEDVEVWEYCPPGLEPRTPRKGKGQTQLKPAALAAVSAGEAIDTFAPAIERAAQRAKGKEAKISKDVSELTRVFAFERVQDGIRFLIDVKRATKDQTRGAVHYGLVMEKTEGLVEGSAAAEAVDVLPGSAYPGAIRVSGSARTHINDRNRRFKVRQIAGATVKLQDQVETVYDIVPKLRPGFQYAMKIAAVLLLVGLGFYFFNMIVRQPQERERALFVSLAPALDGQSWWFDVSPWFTPEMRRTFYKERGRGVNLADLKHHMLVSHEASDFYSKLKERWLPGSASPLTPKLIEIGNLMKADQGQYIRELGRPACYELIAQITKRSEISATDWHLIANLLTSLKPAPNDTNDPASLEQLKSIRSRFGKSSNDYDRALFAFKKAEELYIKEMRAKRQSAEGEIVDGLLGLCYSDAARLHYERRNEFLDVIQKLTQAETNLHSVTDSLLHVYVLALLGESMVRQSTMTQASDRSGVGNYDEDRIEEVFNRAMGRLGDCFPAIQLAGSPSPDDHLYAAVINQHRAHFYLEFWKLGKSERQAELAAATRQKTIDRVIAEGKDPETNSLPGPTEESEIYLDVCRQYIRCNLLKALAAHFSGNAHNAELALEKSIEKASNPEDWEYFAEASQWESFLPNFRQRFADYHIFVSGNLEAAKLELDGYLESAEKMKWNEPTDPRHNIYLSQTYRAAWIEAMLGNPELCAEMLKEIQIPQDKAPLELTVARAFSDGNVKEALRAIVVGQSQDTETVISRDDRQLLLLICEYVRKGIQSPDREELDQAYKFYAKPWQSNNIGNAYLNAIRNRANALRSELADQAMISSRLDNPSPTAELAGASMQATLRSND